ncbi:Dna Repair-Scaffolding Protein [Manis pentadactyla]|nr:Dna Repair-Scaffolding Protein [Manis pentadactyla]
MESIIANWWVKSDNGSTTLMIPKFPGFAFKLKVLIDEYNMRAILTRLLIDSKGQSSDDLLRSPQAAGQKSPFPEEHAPGPFSEGSEVLMNNSKQDHESLNFPEA